MASLDRIGELREKARRIYALSFWGVSVPARLRNLEMCLRHVLDLLTNVQKSFTSTVATQPEIEQTYCNILIGLSEDLDRLHSALSGWTEYPRKLEDADSRETKQRMAESLPGQQVVKQAQETLSLYSYLLENGMGNYE
jgi:hypothetical protein